MKHTKMNTFMGFKLEINDHVSSWFRQMGDGNLDDAIGMVAIDLT